MRMTKNDVINAMAHEIARSLKEGETEMFETGRVVALHEHIQSNYKACKELAESNGYVGACFEDLWHRAVTRLERT